MTRTPLFESVLRRQADVFLLLLKRGADLKFNFDNLSNFKIKTTNIIRDAWNEKFDEAVREFKEWKMQEERWTDLEVFLNRKDDGRYAKLNKNIRRSVMENYF